MFDKARDLYNLQKQARQIKKELKNIHIEGIPQCDWVLIDAGDVIVHIFRPEIRTFYNLEKIWSFENSQNSSKPSLS
mgnify:CR=1 FL=1